MSDRYARLTSKDFMTDQDIRWCPGCGDYSVLANVQRVMPELGVPRENFVFVSGIGCSSRFPYYMNTYGFHTIHGRAPAFATGIKAGTGQDLLNSLRHGAGAAELVQCGRRFVGHGVLRWRRAVCIFLARVCDVPGRACGLFRQLVVGRLHTQSGNLGKVQL